VQSLRELEKYYQSQVQRQGDQISELDQMLAQKHPECDLHRAELEQRKEEGGGLAVQLRQMREALKNLISLNEQKQRQVESLQYQLEASSIEASAAMKFQYNDSINQLILERDSCQNKLIEQEQNYQSQIASLTRELQERSREVDEHRRKYAELMELKRRDDEELKGVRWGAELSRDKLAN
jgi:hypothetical protein